MQLQRNHFNFKHMRQGVLITSDTGCYALLTDAEFQALVQDPDQLPRATLQRLQEGDFVSVEHRELFATSAAERVRTQKSYLMVGTQLHIFVLTRRCNQHCVYCQASAGRSGALTDMSPEVAERAVDLALEGPARSMTFEFQGGEPTLNFETLQHIVNYAEARRGEKQINYSVVSNLVQLTHPMVDFLVEMGISVSTSLDGPRDLHTRNRPFTNGGSYDDVVANIRRLRLAGACGIGTLQTTTRHSLARARDIVDVYVSLGLERLFVRPLTPVGAAARNWSHIGYRPAEFLAFYAELLDYVIRLASEGVEIREEHASTLLKRILNRPTNYMELRSPCGATIGQTAYSYDGSVYPCDEARMLAEAGDPFFRLGELGEVHYTDLIQSPITKALGIASCLESLPGCSDCVYQPYCGVCPVVGYAQHGTIFPQRAGGYRCAIYKGILDLLFGYLTLGDGRTLDLLQSWTD